MGILKNFLLVGLGSFLGGGLRYLCAIFVTGSTSFHSFPIGTFFVNVVGCFLLGFLSSLSYDGVRFSEETKLLFTTGFCGGFTTFSTFMHEHASLTRNGQLDILFIYLFLSLLLGYAAVFLGQFTARLLFRDAK